MKFEQTILILILLNIVNVAVGFVLENQDITQFDTQLTRVIDGDDGMVEKLEAFEQKTRDSDNLFQKITADVIDGISSVVNAVIIIAQVIYLVITSWIAPAKAVLVSSENITILRMVGYFGIIYIYWFNVMVMIKLWKLIKGSDQ